ncbi:Or22a [Drosophila busckii]|uniref:Odorant receptor n=2 Tax=Drosophila busckii TaxID=30019 RepID=A0A0M4EVM2_DROBS|nr:Or22a [Drosophila busckii]
MESVFKRIYPAPLTEQVRSSDGNIYMYRLMRFIGWVPPKKGALRYLYRFWTCIPFIFGVFYLPFGFAISYVREFKQFTPGQFFTSLQVGLNCYGASVKCSITYLSLGRLFKAVQLVDRLDERLRTDSDRQRIHQMVARCNLAFLVFMFTYCGFSFMTFLSYAISGRPAWAVFNPIVDWHNGLLSLWAHCILEYIVVMFPVLQDLLADTFALMFLTMIRAHFEVLKDHVRNLRLDPSKTEQYNYEQLVDCVLAHKLLLRGCDLLRPAISRTIFVQFMLIGSILGLTLINIFFFSDFWRGLASFMFVITILMETFPFCYTCNLLIDDSEELANTLFQSNWTDAEPRYKSTLVHFMHHVQQPVIFIAGGILPISMSSNFSVAKFAFSIITIVRQMNLAEQFQ